MQELTGTYQDHYAEPCVECGDPYADEYAFAKGLEGSVHRRVYSLWLCDVCARLYGRWA